MPISGWGELALLDVGARDDIAILAARVKGAAGARL